MWFLRIGRGRQNRTRLFSDERASRRCKRIIGGRQHGCIAVKSTSKWASLGERVAKLKDGESIVLEPQGDPTTEAGKIRSGLNGRNLLVRRSVKVVDGKIVITHVGIWPMLSSFKDAAPRVPSK
jgi:hypothetical protein